MADHHLPPHFRPPPVRPHIQQQLQSRNFLPNTNFHSQNISSNFQSPQGTGDFQRNYPQFSQNRGYHTPAPLFNLNQDRGNFWGNYQASQNLPSGSFQNPQFQVPTSSFQTVLNNQPVLNNNLLNNPQFQPVYTCSNSDPYRSGEGISGPRRPEFYAATSLTNSHYNQGFHQNFPSRDQVPVHSNLGFPPLVPSSKNSEPLVHNTLSSPQFPQPVPCQSYPDSKISGAASRNNSGPAQFLCQSYPSGAESSGVQASLPQRVPKRSSAKETWITAPIIDISGESSRDRSRRRKLVHEIPSRRNPTLSTPESSIASPASEFKPFNFAFPALNTSAEADKSPKIEPRTFDEILSTPLRRSCPSAASTNISIVSVSSLLKTSADERTPSVPKAYDNSSNSGDSESGNLVIDEGRSFETKKPPTISIQEFEGTPILVPSPVVSPTSDIYSVGSGRRADPLSPISVHSPSSPPLDVEAVSSAGSPVAGPSNLLPSNPQDCLYPGAIPQAQSVPVLPNPSFRWCTLPVSKPVRRGPSRKTSAPNSQFSGAKSKDDDHYEHECSLLGCPGTDTRYLPLSKFPGNFLESRFQISPPNLDNCFKRNRNSKEPWDKNPYSVHLKVGAPEHFKYKSVSQVLKTWYFWCSKGHSANSCRCSFAKTRVLAWIELDYATTKQGRKNWGSVNVSEAKRIPRKPRGGNK